MRALVSVVFQIGRIALAAAVITFLTLQARPFCPILTVAIYKVVLLLVLMLLFKAGLVRPTY